MPARRLIAPLVLLALVATTAIYAVGGRGAPATAATTQPGTGAGVTVEGVGMASAPPDVLRVTIGVQATAPTVQEALDEANAAARRVLDALREEGVAERDVQTVNVQLRSQQERPRPEPEEATEQPTRYVASQDLAVTLRDLDTSGATISAAVEAGGDNTRISGMSFGIEDSDALQEQAREQAFADARRKAEQYAELAGRELGDVLSVREQFTPRGPGPVTEAADARGGEGVPLAPGVSEVRVMTEVRWALQ